MAQISVALPMYNASSTIAATLDALVTQTFKKFNVVLIDDASTDNSLQVVETYRSRLDIKVIENPQNLGISKTRNMLLENISAPYIAILDHDDICHPTRFARQLDFLQSHPDIDICGSAITYFTADTDISTANNVLRHPACDAAIKTTFIHHTAMVHPSAMAKISFFRDVGEYNAQFSPAEDYDLWCRAALAGKKFSNIEDSLLYYRVHPKQTSKVQAETMVRMDIQIKRKYIRSLLNDEADASLPEFLCPYLHHDSNVLATVLPTLFPAILRLADRIPCKTTYATLVGNLFAKSMTRNK